MSQKPPLHSNPHCRIVGHTHDTSRKWLLAILDVLVDLMPHERRLHEEGGGYMREVLDEFPNWNRSVMRLHLKKLHLDYALRETRNKLRREASWVGCADQLSCELRDWMKMFTDLHNAESSLLVEAMLLDVGAGD